MYTLPKDPRVTLIAGELARVMAEYDAILDTLPASAIDEAPEGLWSPVQIIWHLSKVQHWVSRGIEQGAAALRLWSGRNDVPVEVMRQALLEQLP